MQLASQIAADELRLAVWAGRGSIPALV